MARAIKVDIYTASAHPPPRMNVGYFRYVLRGAPCCHLSLDAPNSHELGVLAADARGICGDVQVPRGPEDVPRRREITLQKTLLSSSEVPGLPREMRRRMEPGISARWLALKLTPASCGHSLSDRIIVPRPGCTTMPGGVQRVDDHKTLGETVLCDQVQLPQELAAEPMQVPREPHQLQQLKQVAT